MYDERYRPQFHFSARENWLNDPNGLVFYDGIYHLFFQHNPSGLEWGNMTWGHAVSRDLVRWTQLDHVLLPDTLGTMFSGSAVVDWRNTTGFRVGDHPPIILIYTAAGGTSPESEGQPFTQCLAYSTDGGKSWQKYPRNPVLPCVGEGNRDPKVIWHEPTNRWVMTLYLNKDRFAFFNSPNLIDWTHLHDIRAPGSIECPDFFELPVANEPGGSKWVWIAGDGRYYLGEFDGDRFAPETDLLTGDYGANFYACQSYSDIPSTDGRRIQMAWMRGGEYPGMPFNQQMSFPCELGLLHTAQGLRLTRLPVREIESLHSGRIELTDLTLVNDTVTLPQPGGELFDITCAFDPGEASGAGLVIRGARVEFSPRDRQISCLGCHAPLHLIDGQVRLRILVDRTSIEVFSEDGLVSMTSCFLPDLQAPKIALFAAQGAALFSRITINELTSAWNSVA